MKDEILEILKDEGKAQTITAINSKLKFSTVEELNELEKCLKELTTEGILHESRAHEFMLMKNTKALKVGILRINKSGNGFVDQPGEKDIFIKSEDLNGAINGDFVEAEIHNKITDPDPEGHIIKILKRDLKNVVGEIVKNKNQLAFKADDDKLNIIIKITKTIQMISSLCIAINFPSYYLFFGKKFVLYHHK